MPADTVWMNGHDGQSIAIVPSRELAVLRAALRSQVESPTFAIQAAEIDDAALREALRTNDPRRRGMLLWPGHELANSAAAFLKAVQSATGRDRSWTGTERLSDERGDISRTASSVRDRRASVTDVGSDPAARLR